MLIQIILILVIAHASLVKQRLIRGKQTFGLIQSE